MCFNKQSQIIKYIPLQQGLRLTFCLATAKDVCLIIKYIPLQQGLRHPYFLKNDFIGIIKYIPLQQGLRLKACVLSLS